MLSRLIWKFSSRLGYSFLHFLRYPPKHESFKAVWSLIYIFLLLLELLMQSSRNCCLTPRHKNLPLSFLLRVLDRFILVVRSVVHAPFAFMVTLCGM